MPRENHAPTRTCDAPYSQCREDYEILAPAGNWAAFAAARHGGADAVYFGVEKLNMRVAAAKTFLVADLPEIARRTKDLGLKTRLTVNTLLYDGDMDDMMRTMDAAKAANIDAVIVSDPAAILYARRIGLEVHLSTQLSISNTESLAFWSPYADVAVLARELTLEKIAAVADEAKKRPILGPSGRPVRLEIFCHGAMCMAVSGRCHLSFVTRGKSANRGECLQNCRRTYRIVDKERGFEIDVDNERFLSPKDMKTVDIMDRLVASGATVFKIEGRARGPEYVRTTCACYDEALRAVLAGEWSENCRTRWNDRLATVFNRGFWPGWYLGAEDMARTSSYGSSATEKKIHAGKCLNYFKNACVGYFLVEAGELKNGDKVLVVGPTSGAVPCIIKDLRINDRPATEDEAAKKGDEITFKVPERVRAQDKLYRIAEA